MKRAGLLLVMTLASLFFIHAAYEPTPTIAGSNPLTTALLSDHSLTEADTFISNYSYDLVTHNNVAHVYWQESGNGTEGTDLFYRQLPGGSTIRLSDPALSEGDVNTFLHDTAVAPDGTFHMIWLEDTGTSEANDLFYWSAATGTALLSNRTETEGFVKFNSTTLHLIMDTNGNPHTFWYEDTGTSEGYDLFYWSKSTGTVLLTDRSQTEGSDVNFGPNRLATGEDGTAHVTWAEVGNDSSTSTYFYWNSTLATPIILPGIQSSIVAGNVAHIIWGGQSEGPLFYWNSATQSSQTIPSSSDPGGYVFARMVADSTNTVHVLWSEGASNICLSHWDSTNQTSSELVTGEVCLFPWNIYVDNTDSLHTVVGDQPSGIKRYRYWNDNLANPIPVFSGNSSSDGTMTGIEGTNEVHITWIDSPGPGPDSNFYHWDNVNQTVNTLSEAVGANIQAEPSSNGILYLLWDESVNGSPQNFFWNSETNATQNLFTELGISSIPSGDNEMTLAFLQSGLPFLTWYGTPTVGPDGFYLWDSAQDEIHLVGESEPCLEIGDSFSNDSDTFGNIYLAWQDTATKTNYWWSKATGQVDLSLTSAAETNCNTPVTAVSDNGSVFVMWIEASDVAGEGQDVYAGWVERSTNSTFISFIVR